MFHGAVASHCFKVDTRQLLKIKIFSKDSYNMVSACL